ncbi:sensor histidine kinase [Alkaliphilus hydrothermalis]|uniref:histidine kinase n=1 Tax=Alkaliphilus hydrothermalis TaxID=1482730 RepID=A0ABS2NSV6_9FIRM|nr:HAMP domain-containing sensor histidine kinase [Alkaliphilus hydrothermalis]MBM7616043.1 signal transduction histidine kinase [Alkaliphilus hydrothermalis]
MPFNDLIEPSWMEDFSNIKKKVVSSNSATFEICYLTKDNKPLPVEVNSHLFMLKEEMVILSIVRDLSEGYRNLELEAKVEQEEKLLKEALEYDQLKTEFFSNLSHELRTPLNVILGTLQLFELNFKDLYLNIETTKSTKQLNILKQNCYRLLRLTNNLIDITRIDAGFYQVNPQSCNIVSIVEQITGSVAEYVANKSVDLIFDTDVEEKIISCDPDQIERIILNLLSNAIKFTKPLDTITVSIEDKQSHISISVHDTGVGIPQNKLDIIFERFRQVDKSFTRKHEGSGIGLSLVQSLIKLHGGSIQVESEYGKGCKFTVILPAILDEEADELVYLSYRTINENIERISIEFSDIYDIQ